MAAKLTLRVPLMPDELATDYCARLALRNFRSASEFALDMGFALSDLRQGNDDTLVRLAEISDTPLRRLREAAVRNLGKRYFLRGQTLDSGSLHLRQFYVCSKCLQDDINMSDAPAGAAMQLRSHWMLASINVCMKHNLVLQNVGNRLIGQVRRDWSQVALSLAPKLNRLSDIAVERAPTQFETYLFDRFNGKTQGTWLDSLEFFVVERTARMFGLVATGDTRADGRSANDGRFSKADDEGYLISRSGPPGICKLLSEVERKNYEERRMKKKSPTPAYLYGKIYERLRRNAAIPEFAPVVDVVSEHIISNFPFAAGDLLFNKPVIARRVHSVHTLSKELGVSDTRVRSVFRKMGLLPCPGRKDKEAVFNASEVEALIRSDMDGISQAAAEKHLNIGKPFMEKLIRKGLIKHQGLTDGIQSHKFAKSELDAFFNRLVEGAVAVAPGDVGSLLNISQAAVRTRCLGPDIVKMILNRKLSKVGLLSDTIGIEAILVDPDEIMAMFDEFDVPGRSPVDVATTLKTSAPIVRELVKRKLIHASLGKSRMTGKILMRVTDDAVEQFTTQFVSLFHLAKDSGRGGKLLKRELAAKGIFPAKETEGLSATFYRRSDLPSL